MDTNQAWRDTICLLAGNPARRSARPGEKFDLPTPSRKPRRPRARVLLAAVCVLIAISVIPALLLA